MHYLGEVENTHKTLANIFRTLSTTFYQNRPGFVDDVTKTSGVFLGLQFELLFTYKTQH